jgi:prepilin-type N-terminal cleavage/methylation domain-containing protein
MNTLFQKAKGKRQKAKSFRLRFLAFSLYPSAFPVRARRRGFTLIEMLVYIALLAVVLGVTTTAFYHCWDNSKALRRNADDIILVLHAGEQWRADVRGANGALELSRTVDGERLLVPSAGGPIIYTFAAGELRRQTASPAATNLLFTNIQSSQMQSEQRQRVQAWTWELELKPTRKDARVRPLFTFESVAGPANTR